MFDMLQKCSKQNISLGIETRLSKFNSSVPIITGFVSSSPNKFNSRYPNVDYHLWNVVRLAKTRRGCWWRLPVGGEPLMNHEFDWAFPFENLHNHQASTTNHTFKDCHVSHTAYAVPNLLVLLGCPCDLIFFWRNSAVLCKVGPLLVKSRVITPLIRVITPVTHFIFGHFPISLHLRITSYNYIAFVLAHSKWYFLPKVLAPKSMPCCPRRLRSAPPRPP